jgi:glycosyltransferase involved in cell wall biosynthesis
MILPIARALKIPLVVSFHGHDVGGLEPQNKGSLRYFRYQKLAPELFSYAARLLCASAELAELLIARGAPPSKVHLHHLGVDIDTFGQPHRERDGKGILVVGRLVEKKGIDDALRAFAQVATRISGARLVIVGEGPLRASLNQLARQLGLHEKVQFRGALAPTEVQAEMHEASILLTPSYTTKAGDRESGVIVVKEGGATGLPTVATHHGGLPEIVDDGKTGFLVQERDIGALADRLERLLRSADLREIMGGEARRAIVTRYNSRIQNAALEEHLVQAACTQGR